MFQHLKIGKTQNADFQFRQFFCASPIILNRVGFEVLGTIQFHDQAHFDAVEIDDESSDGDLAAEFESADLTVANERPEFALGIDLMVSEAAGESGEAMIEFASAVREGMMARRVLKFKQVC